MNRHRETPPTLEQRLNQAELNWQYLKTVDTGHPDWGITVKFYTGMHYITAVAIRLGAPSPHSHGERFEYLERVRIPREVRKAFSLLYENSLTARYKCEPFDLLFELNDLATDALDTVRNYARKLLQLEN